MPALAKELKESAAVVAAQSSKSRRRILMGCPVDLLTGASLLSELTEAIEKQSGPKVIQFINANKIAQVQKDTDMGRIMWRADYVLTDGQPLLPMGRLLGVNIPERIDGIGLMGKLLKLANDRRYRVFLLGAKQSVLDTCLQKIQTPVSGTSAWPVRATVIFRRRKRKGLWPRFAPAGAIFYFSAWVRR